MKKITLGMILLAGAALRLFKLAKMAPFGADQEFAAEFAWQVTRVFPVRLVGQGLSILDLFMGPWYFYFLVPFYLLFGLHPIGGAVGSVVLGVVTIGVFYWVGKELFGEEAGLVAAFLRAVSFAAISTDWTVTPAFSSGLIILITWWLFWKYWQGETKIFPWLGLVLGLYTSFHPILLPFWLVFGVLLLLRRKWPSWGQGLGAVAAFGLAVSPLLVFEVIRHWAMTGKLISLLAGGGREAMAGERLAMIARTWNNGLGQTAAVKYGWVVGLVLVAWLGRQRERFHLVMLGVTLVTFAVYYAFFPAHVPEYYVGVLDSLFLLYLAAMLASWLKKPASGWLAVLVIVGVTVVNWQQLDKHWKGAKTANIANKEAIVREIVERQAGERFYVSYITAPGWRFGWDYWFRWLGRESDGKVEQPIYTIVAPKELSAESIDISSGGLGLILPD